MKSYKPNHASSTNMIIGYFIEECGEALAAAGKSIRWGLASFNPELPESDRELNKDWLLREAQDVNRASALLINRLLGNSEERV